VPRGGLDRAAWGRRAVIRAGPFRGPLRRSTMYPIRPGGAQGAGRIGAYVPPLPRNTDYETLPALAVSRRTRRRTG
jgi:hypothetical protein